MKLVQMPKHTKLLAMIWILGALMLTASVSFAQSNAGFTVEVVVADPGAKQRSSAYWLALDRVLRRELPAGSVDEPTRKDILREPSRYVQAYRYRQLDPARDARRLSTRQVREGDAPDSVIAVTFPGSLLSIIQRQNQPVAVVEESVVQSTGNVLALIAVQQDGSEFLIGGERGKKFQSRLLQLGVANNLSFEFPAMDSADQAILQPSNVLYSETDAIVQIAEKYTTASYFTGALVRLSANAWQSDWTLQVQGQQPQSVTLTTQSLDEALITAVTELANNGNQSLINSGYLVSDSAFQRSGVAVRIENLNSLAQYEQVLAFLRKIDPSVVTEALEPGYTVFRSSADTALLQQRLASQPRFVQLPQDEYGNELNYQFQ